MALRAWLAVLEYESAQASIALVTFWLCTVIIALPAALAENRVEALAVVSVATGFPGLKNVAGHECCHVLGVQRIRAAPLG